MAENNNEAWEQWTNLEWAPGQMASYTERVGDKTYIYYEDNPFPDIVYIGFMGPSSPHDEKDGKEAEEAVQPSNGSERTATLGMRIDNKEKW